MNSDLYKNLLQEMIHTISYQIFLKHIDKELDEIKNTKKFKNDIKKAKAKQKGTMLKIYLMSISLDIMEAQINLITKNINSKSFDKTDNPRKCHQLLISKGDKIHKSYIAERSKYQEMLKKDSEEAIRKKESR
jgi:hypothetical protein